MMSCLQLPFAVSYIPCQFGVARICLCITDEI